MPVDIIGLKENMGLAQYKQVTSGGAILTQRCRSNQKDGA